MLTRRLISAFVIIAVMLLLLWLDFWLGRNDVWGRPGIIVSLLGMLLAALAASEMISLWQPTQRPNSALVIVSTLAMVLVSCLPALVVPISTQVPFLFSFGGVLLAFSITICFEMTRFGTEKFVNGLVADRLGRAILIYVYISMLFGFLLPHRLLENSNGLGLVSLIALISTVKLSDSFAYFVGKSFGTMKLAPLLSPKKTIQGVMGALVGGVVASAIVVFVVAPYIFGITIEKPWWWFVLYGLLITLAGTVGDLAESLLKRDADCKDSSRWLPGLGGVLDVMDSLIFAAPVSYCLWMMS